MSYPGSKAQTGVWQRIIGQMPPHSVYVEPFAGSAQVFWRKRRAEFSLLVDRNPKVIAAANAKLGADAGATVKAVIGNALDWLPEISAWLPADAVLYCDPPYMLETRQGRLYYGEFEMTDEDHATLLVALVDVKARVLISGYPHPLYSSQLRGWRCLEYTTMTRGGKRKECLWCNFDEPGELHDWRFAGFNYRQRYHMKRFVTRWFERLDRIGKSNPRRAGYIMHEFAAALHQRQERRLGPTAGGLVSAVNASGGATR